MNVGLDTRPSALYLGSRHVHSNFSRPWFLAPVSSDLLANLVRALGTPDALLLIPSPRHHRFDTTGPMLLFCRFSFFLLFFFWNFFAAVRPTISARLGRAVVRVVPSPLERAAAVGSDPQSQRIELDKALGVGLIIGTAIVVKGGDISVEQTV